jgi:hypothetical protein
MGGYNRLGMGILYRSSDSLGMDPPIHSSYTLTFYFLPIDGYLTNGHPQLLGYVQQLNVKCPTHKHTGTMTQYRLLYYVHTCSRFL